MLLFVCEFFAVVVVVAYIIELFTQINIIKPWSEDKTRRQTLLYFDWLIGENQHLWRICSVDLRRPLESTSPTAIHVQRHVLVPLVEVSILQNSSFAVLLK